MKVILDTDIGSDVDDALALLLLLHLADVELLGVTTVYGMTDLRAKVARKILDAAGIDVPVYAGAREPLRSPMPIWHAGTEGEGLLSAEEMDASLEDFRACTGAEEFIVEQVTAAAGDVTVIALGALTNLAKAMAKEPKVMQHCRIVFMGGGITYQDPCPERLEPGKRYFSKASHNIRCDVQAAQEVFSTACEIRVLTNDVTTRVWWDGPVVQKLLHASRPPEVVPVARLLEVWLSYRTKLFGKEIKGTCPHDALTVAEAVCPRFVEYERGIMTIEPSGATCFIPCAEGPHLAGRSVDADSFLEWLNPRLLGC